jgi:hypothetical protein
MAGHATPTDTTTEDTVMGYLVPAAPVPVTADNALAVTYLRKAGSALCLAETLSDTRGRVRQYFVQVAAVYGDMARCAQLRRSGTVAEILHRADKVLADLVAAELVDTEDFADLRILAGLELADELVRHATQTDDLTSTNRARTEVL